MTPAAKLRRAWRHELRPPVAVARRFHHDPVTARERPRWPPEPFAPVHWALVEVAAGGHAVVMLDDGSVLDPWDRSRTTLRHPAYLKVHSVTGVWPVALNANNEDRTWETGT